MPIDYYSPIDRVLPLLSSVKPQGQGRWLARCPAHEDKHPSLSVATGHDGAVLLHCWGGCDTGDVLAALGLDWPDLFSRQSKMPYTQDRRAYPRLSAGEALQIIKFELVGLHVCASHMSQGRFDADVKALLEAASRRINTVLAEVPDGR